MNEPFHYFSELFAQLGLPNDNAEIASFITTHGPLPDHVPIEEARFWTPAQSALLCEMRAQDADWALVVDQLSTALRRS